MRDLLRSGERETGELRYLPFILGRLLSVFGLAAVQLHSNYLTDGDRA
jgi:hypothetical protein